MFKNYVPDVVHHMRERDENGDFQWVRRMTSELFGGKKVLLFGLPGAFTPTCTNEQLPKYEELYDKFIGMGFDEVWCTSVNDAFSMFQWAKMLGIEKVKMLPDGNGDLASGLGMLVDKSNLGFGKSSWRYAYVVQDMSIERWFEEEGVSDNCPDDPYGVSCPMNVLSELTGGGTTQTPYETIDIPL